MIDEQIKNDNEREKLEAIISSGILMVHSGKVEININNGQIQNIHLRQRTFYRRKEDDKKLSTGDL